MLNNLKKCVGDFSIKLGKQAVGKCMVPGMFDPKIPDELVKNADENTLAKNICNIAGVRKLGARI